MHSMTVRPTSRASDLPRSSSASARPSLSELVAYGYKPMQPKVKLGPRPAADPRPSLDRSGRPRTAGSGTSVNFDRPKSSLPAGLRMRPRQGVSDRAQSKDPHLAPALNAPQAPPVPDVPSISIMLSQDRPKTSPASVKSLPATLPKTARITPEKQRLLRAVELRKKQMNKRASQAVPEVPQLPPESLEPSAEHANGMLEPDADWLSQRPSSAHDHFKADSGVEIDLPQRRKSEKSTPTADNATPTSDKDSTRQDTDDALSTRPTSVSELSDQSKPAGHDDQDSADASSDKDETPMANEGEEEGVQNRASITPTGSASEQPSARPESAVSEATFTETPTAKLSEPVETDQQEDTSTHSRPHSMVSHTTLEDADEPISPAAGPADAEPAQAHGELDLRRRRRAMVEPIQVEMSTESSEVEYSDDDSLIEELQSATVHEAKPVSYSATKSPITPVFPRPRTSDAPPQLNQRSASDSVYLKKVESTSSLTPDVPPRASFRSSTATLATMRDTATAQHEAAAAPKKVNVGSSISQRIRALTEKANRDSSVPSMPGPTGPAFNPNSSLVSQRKSSFRSLDSDSSIGSRPQSSFNVNIAPQLRQTPRASWRPVTPNLQPIDTSATGNSAKPRKRESISVTARIIRDPRAEKPDLAPPTEMTPLELHQSPIIINHPKPQSPPPAPAPVVEPISPPQPEPAEPTSPTKSVREPSLALPRSSTESSWRSFGRVKSPTALPKSSSKASLGSVDVDSVDDETREEKKGSKTSRMLKRMSLSLSNTSRKGLAVLSPTVKEEHETVEPPTPAKSRPKPTDIGELNVQFPDNLVCPLP